MLFLRKRLINECVNISPSLNDLHVFISIFISFRLIDVPHQESPLLITQSIQHTSVYIGAAKSCCVWISFEKKCVHSIQPTSYVWKAPTFPNQTTSSPPFRPQLIRVHQEPQHHSRLRLYPTFILCLFFASTTDRNTRTDLWSFSLFLHCKYMRICMETWPLQRTADTQSWTNPTPLRPFDDITSSADWTSHPWDPSPLYTHFA